MRVLLIEDDSATAQSIELMLKSESYILVVRSWSANDSNHGSARLAIC